MVQYDTKFRVIQQSEASLDLLQLQREELSDHLQTFRELARQSWELWSNFEESIEEYDKLMVTTKAIRKEISRSAKKRRT